MSCETPVEVQFVRDSEWMDAQFWPQVERTLNGCWLWRGSVNGTAGYGCITPRWRHRLYAHRLAYISVNGPIPDGLEIDHLCSNPPCVNPDHLEAVTHAENIKRGRSGSRPDVCIHGHPLTAENTYWQPARGSKRAYRRCRACLAAASRRYLSRRRAEAELISR